MIRITCAASQVFAVRRFQVRSRVLVGHWMARSCGLRVYLQQCSWDRVRGESEMYVAREVVVENDPEKLDQALAVYRSRVDELEKVGCVASYLLRDRSEARLTWLSVWEEGSTDARGEQTQKRVEIARQVAEVLGGVRQTIPELEVLERFP